MGVVGACSKFSTVQEMSNDQTPLCGTLLNYYLVDMSGHSSRSFTIRYR